MYQRLVLVGNLGRDPEMRYTPQGTPVTTFPVATSRKYTTADGQQKEETVWFRVQVWGKQGETVNQYLAKGRKVLVEGTLIPDENWRTDGVDWYKTAKHELRSKCAHKPCASSIASAMSRGKPPPMARLPPMPHPKIIPAEKSCRSKTTDAQQAACNPSGFFYL